MAVLLIHEQCTRSLGTLSPFEQNSRTHSEAQIEQIAQSIKQYGFTNPVLIDEDNTIVAGHGRVMAATKLGMTELPCVILKGLSESQRRAYVIADNKLALNAGWDIDILLSEIQLLKDDGFDVDLTGFSLDELEKLTPQVIAVGLTDDDAVPDAPNEPITKPDDVWLLGNHRLMCGDSTSIDAVDKLMNGVKSDMVFTDPPYGVEYQSNMRTKSKKFDVLANDNALLDIAPVIHSASDGWVFVWTSWKVINKWISQLASFGYPSNMVIWHKPGGGIGDLKKTFASDYEVALVWNRGAPLCGKRIGSVWTINKDGSSTYVHPTQKPVALAIEAIDKCTRSDSHVLDLFGGSGSTMIACEKTGRHCYMMELDPKYCDVIVKRWEQFTGKKAVLDGA